MSLIKIQKIYPIKPQTHSNPTSAIETMTDKIKSQETDAIYHNISKSEATNVDRYLITSILSKLKSQNVIPINQQPRATIRKKIHKTLNLSDKMLKTNLILISIYFQTNLNLI